MTYDPDSDHDDDAAPAGDIPSGDPAAPEERLEQPDSRDGTGGLTAERAECLIPKEVG
ncbi:MAG TPA: hypothetical protein VFO60_01860 [Candidatus Dormibacteraeota bacterium]|nr:hypothetical protein [Candidatus Dormibacteraeota bacterium]